MDDNNTTAPPGIHHDTTITAPPQDVILEGADQKADEVNAVNAAFEVEGATLEEQKQPAADGVDTECICDDVDTKASAIEGPPVEGNNAESIESNGDKRKAGEMEAPSLPSDVAAEAAAKKKRLCRYPGCVKVIKSQGHCQRHGAKAKRCKVEECDKQAQGTHDGMCKRHWKAANFPEETTKKSSTPPEPEGESVYDSILPMSIAYRPVQLKQVIGDDPSKHDLLDPPAAPAGFQTMPLVAHLKEGSMAGKQAGWHRNAERRARGMFPVKGLSVQLEPWERQLAMIEIMLLSGGTPYANFKDLAFAWGREKGFHHVLANSVCERRGEVERKKRSDYGKSMTDDEKSLFKSKLQKTREKNGTSSKKARQDSVGGDEAVADLDVADHAAEEDSMPKIEPVDDVKAVGEEANEDQEKVPAAAAADGPEAVGTPKVPAVFV